MIMKGLHRVDDDGTVGGVLVVVYRGDW